MVRLQLFLGAAIFCVWSAGSLRVEAASPEKSKVGRQSSQPSPDEILRRTDEVRCPSESYFMEVEVISKSDDSVVKLEVLTKGRDKTRVNTILPTRDRGRNMVMIGEEMWA